jgi:small subunit ribosomal protein S18
MARGGGSSERTSRRSPKDALRRGAKKKPCALCKDKIDWVDYKDVGMLRRYMSDRGKIRARRVTGNCTQHQRAIALAIKTARELVLLPYTQRTTTERSAGRGRGPRGDRPERSGPGRPVVAVAVPEAADEALLEETAENLDEPEELAEIDLIDVIEVPTPASGDGAEAEPLEGSVPDAVAGNGAAAGGAVGNGS